MAAPIAVTAPSCVQNLKKSSSRRFDGKSMSLDDRDYTECSLNSGCACVIYKSTEDIPFLYYCQ